MKRTRIAPTVEKNQTGWMISSFLDREMMWVMPPPRSDPMTPSTSVQRSVMCTCITDFEITPAAARLSGTRVCETYLFLRVWPSSGIPVFIHLRPTRPKCTAPTMEIAWSIQYRDSQQPRDSAPSNPLRGRRPPRETPFSRKDLDW